MKNLIIAVAAVVAAVSGIAGEVNLRDWLTAKGVTVSGCVSGVGHHPGYGPERLFDGTKGVTIIIR